MLHESVVAHLKGADYISRMDVWVSHELSNRNLQQCLDSCDLLLEKNKKLLFSKKMIIRDEKLIVLQ